MQFPPAASKDRRHVADGCAARGRVLAGASIRYDPHVPLLKDQKKTARARPLYFIKVSFGGDLGKTEQNRTEQNRKVT